MNFFLLILVDFLAALELIWLIVHRYVDSVEKGKLAVLSTFVVLVLCDMVICIRIQWIARTHH